MPKASDQRGDRTRQLILQSAADLVIEKGWQQVTSRQVASHAGVNQALVHYHFGSMEALLRQAVISRLEQEMAEPIAKMLASASPGEGLRHMSDWLRALDPGGPMASLSAEVLAAATRDEEIRAWLAGLLIELRQQMAESIAAGQRAGRVRADISPEAVAMLSAALVDGLGFHALIDPQLQLAGVAETLDALLAAPIAKGRQ